VIEVRDDWLLLMAGGCHGGASAGDTRLSHRNTHQPTSPNGFVSD